MPEDGQAKLRDVVHAGLAQSAAALVNVQLDDVLQLSDAQNLPGTIDEHPNWRRRYAVPIEKLDGLPEFKRMVGQMNSGDRGSIQKPRTAD